MVTSGRAAPGGAGRGQAHAVRGSRQYEALDDLGR